MEFSEKLQELRKSRGLTQEELAKALYVSRAAVSKWESARGYPGIDSLKEISRYFSVPIDDLLSGEKILHIAEKENQSNIKNICSLLFGMADISYFVLFVLPLYPNVTAGHIYTVNLFMYTQVSPFIRGLYIAMFSVMIAMGCAKILFTRNGMEKISGIATDVSMIINAMVMMLLVITRGAWAGVIVFLLFVIKTVLILKCFKTK